MISSKHREQPTQEVDKLQKDPERAQNEKLKTGDAAYFKHPQISVGGYQDMLTNDMAYHLHHPQFDLKGPNLPFKIKPKC